MTLDTLIAKCLEAKEHCVPGNSEVNIWFSDITSLTEKDKLVGNLSFVDYDNNGVNLYFDNL